MYIYAVFQKDSVEHEFVECDKEREHCAGHQEWLARKPAVSKVQVLQSSQHVSDIQDARPLGETRSRVRHCIPKETEEADRWDACRKDEVGHVADVSDEVGLLAPVDACVIASVVENEREVSYEEDK